MNIENAKNVDGFMTEPELTWLANTAANKHMILEVGSWKGRSTRAIADNTTGIIVAVDTFAGTENEGDAHKEAFENGPDYIFNLFKSNLNPYIKEEKVIPIRSNSMDAAITIWEKYGSVFDMIFIDADHRSPGVDNDIKAYMPLLKDKGIFCGHDYYYGDVTRAVKNIVPSHSVMKDGSIWHT